MTFYFLLRGALSLILIAINTLCCLVPIAVLAILKRVLPFSIIRSSLNRLLNGIATIWIDVNNFNQKCLGRSVIDVSGVLPLSDQEWYMIVANHQSWVDILVLQRVFNRQIPFIKFFIKQELIWVPFIGLAWWALDFPFMKRYSSNFLKKHPELKGKDIEITRNACKKFRYFPVSIMNFLEGTRFTHAKHQDQASPFVYLLKPKAGGLSFALNAMNGKLDKLIDVTIVYPEKNPSFFDYLSGRITRIQVHVRIMEIEDSLLGDYLEDKAYREHFQNWVNDLWVEKDKRIALMQSAHK